VFALLYLCSPFLSVFALSFIIPFAFIPFAFGLPLTRRLLFKV